MHRSVNILLAISLVVACTSFSQQPVQLSAKTDSTVYEIGSWVDVHITGRFESPVESISPSIKDSLGPFEVVNVDRVENGSAWLVRLTTLDSGKVFLPPIAFQYKTHGDTTTHVAYTNSLFLTINSVSVNPQGEIKDIKPPMNAPWLFVDYIPYIIALVIVTGIIAGIYFYQKKKLRISGELEKVKIVIPPHREALTALRILEEKKLWQQGATKEYYSEVTEIVRKFFEKRWNIIALELTSDEIMQQMRHIPESLPIWKQMESFFLVADLVKFAKDHPSPSDNENEITIAYEIVRAMVPREPAEQELQHLEVIADVR